MSILVEYCRIFVEIFPKSSFSPFLEIGFVVVVVVVAVVVTDPAGQLGLGKFPLYVESFNF